MFKLLLLLLSPFLSINNWQLYGFKVVMMMLMMMVVVVVVTVVMTVLMLSYRKDSMSNVSIKAQCSILY